MAGIRALVLAACVTALLLGGFLMMLPALSLSHHSDATHGYSATVAHRVR